ncbi:unnamed protein product [Paramecium sonneborni]|uniref:Uncharacterized protein n=1 Tax=Paramecium sonneborni TaxID=65129 RepID=A0A8S1REL6_9CILI|nr:unnamed protein product [Paramecium sonneborni]
MLHSISHNRSPIISRSTFKQCQHSITKISEINIIIHYLSRIYITIQLTSKQSKDYHCYNKNCEYFNKIWNSKSHHSNQSLNIYQTLKDENYSQTSQSKKETQNLKITIIRR